MIKKILKSLLGSHSKPRYYSSSDTWKKHKKHKHYGHHYYKKKYKSKSFFSSFFSS
jgi:hypothetical protein